jgi:hypothetical protein
MPEDIMAAARDSAADIDVRFAGLQQRVSGIEQAVQGVAQQVSALATTLNDRSRTPWGILISGAGFMMGVVAVVGGLAYAPIREAIADTKADIRLISENGLSIAAFGEFKNTYENNRIASRNDNDAKFAAMRLEATSDIARIEEQLKGQVPRAEHERVWASYDQRFTDQQRQIDEIKSNQASTYGVRDVILDYRDRLDRLERSRQGIPAG